MAGGRARFRPSDYVIRFLFVYALIVATWNPTGYSYIDWALASDGAYIAVKVFVGLSLFLIYGFLADMARRALLRRGMLLAVLFFASAGWALWSQGLLPDRASPLALLVEAAVAATLAAGLSLVPLWQQASGQVTAVPDVH